MKVTFDEEGYVEFLATNGDLPNSIEIPDDNTLNYKYLNCYMLNEEGNGLILDAAKVQALESNLTAASKIYDLKKRLNETDYQVLRMTRETQLGLTPTVTEEEHLRLEAERESLSRQIIELEKGVSLTTDVDAILEEGKKAREEKKEKKGKAEDAVANEIPKIKEDIKRLEKEIKKLQEQINGNSTEPEKPKK